MSVEEGIFRIIENNQGMSEHFHMLARVARENAVDVARVVDGQLIGGIEPVDLLADAIKEDLETRMDYVGGDLMLTVDPKNSPDDRYFTESLAESFIAWSLAAIDWHKLAGLILARQLSHDEDSYQKEG